MMSTEAMGTMETNSSHASVRHAAHKAFAAGVLAAKACSPRPVRAPSGPALRPYQQVAERICALVAEAGLGPGERLPSERELAVTLAVSRATLRQAITSLELGGVVEVRAFSGVYLCAPLQSAAPTPQAAPGPFAMLSARRLIEPELAAMAARVATDGSVAQLAAAADAVERVLGDRAGDNAACELADRHFHLTLAAATGNAALASVLEHLWGQRGGLSQALERPCGAAALQAETLADYRRIVGAVAARDATGARNAMRAHLDRLARGLLRG